MYEYDSPQESASEDMAIIKINSFAIILSVFALKSSLFLFFTLLNVIRRYIVECFAISFIIYIWSFRQTVCFVFMLSLDTNKKLVDCHVCKLTHVLLVLDITQ